MQMRRNCPNVLSARIDNVKRARSVPEAIGDAIRFSTVSIGAFCVEAHGCAVALILVERADGQVRACQGPDFMLLSRRNSLNARDVARAALRAGALMSGAETTGNEWASRGTALHGAHLALS